MSSFVVTFEVHGKGAGGRNLFFAGVSSLVASRSHPWLRHRPNDAIVANLRSASPVHRSVPSSCCCDAIALHARHGSARWDGRRHRPTVLPCLNAPSRLAWGMLDFLEPSSCLPICAHQQGGVRGRTECTRRGGARVWKRWCARVLRAMVWTGWGIGDADCGSNADSEPRAERDSLVYAVGSAER